MSKSNDFWILVGLSIAIIAMLGIGIYTSPTYTDKLNYINSLILFLEVIFVTSATLLVLWHGFKEFGVMLAIIVAAIISLFGIEAALIAILFTYITWGFAFTIELLLAHNGVQSAIFWFQKHYSVRAFEIEFKIFYPMMIIMYILLEIIPNLIYKDPVIDFKPKELFEAMRNELKKSRRD